MAKKSVADRFLSYMKRYHTGSEKAIKTDELAEIYKLEPRTLQSMVHRLRLDGYPICGDRDGYFYASGPDDIKYTAKWLMNMGYQVQNTACAMLMAAELDKNAATVLNDVRRIIVTL